MSGEKLQVDHVCSWRHLPLKTMVCNNFMGRGNFLAWIVRQSYVASVARLSTHLTRLRGCGLTIGESLSGATTLLLVAENGLHVLVLCRQCWRG
jgi:hypothetical protein